MANICSTQITFYSNDKELLENFKQKLTKYCTIPYNNNVTNPKWVGNILMHFLHADYDKITKKDTRCWINFIMNYDVEQCLENKEYYSFYIETEDAWAVHIEPFRKILKEYYKDAIKLAYIASEPGCEYFVKNDPDDIIYYNCEYFVDMFEPPDVFIKDNPEYQRISELYDYGNQLHTKNLLRIFNVSSLGKVMNLVDKLNDKLEEKYPDEGYYVHIFPYKNKE